VIALSEPIGTRLIDSTPHPRVRHQSFERLRQQIDRMDLVQHPIGLSTSDGSSNGVYDENIAHSNGGLRALTSLSEELRHYLADDPRTNAVQRKRAPLYTNRK
jgi:hypothetical protein